MKRKAIIVLFVIYLAFIALGLPDALLGSAWNLTRDELGVSVGSIGIITLISYILTMIATYNAPAILKHVQTKTVTFISIVLSSLALLAISQINSFYQIILFAIPLGISAGAIDMSLNHYIAVHFKASHMSYLHSFYGLGVTFGPLIMAKTLENNSWRNGYIVVGILLLVIAVAMLLSFPFWDEETKEHRDEHHTHHSLKSILQTKGVKHSLAIFLIYVHIESLLGVFIASYVYEIKGFSYSEAALATMSYFLALTLGRIMSGILSDKLHPNILIISGEIVMLLGSLLLLLPLNNIYLIYLFVGLIGLGSGPVFPNMMHMNPSNFDKQKMSKIMSLQMVIGYLGFGLITPLMGQVFDLVSINIYPYITTIMSFVLLIITVQLIQFKLHIK
ncbi:MFS transporter [Candidatus Xianfuyuplasma coldseepsis]|uniref:MFS transporter n=1 Tax=Candidatus Xianfuyuplasma coldseepsis TaxID=2782163 RepID=A0A7L7KPC4_9MOLU|nr:MFS transporter [Xianfuyuplasma coldseepsis]QMS84631.1 MFS transporter [Xianfuyuplasma coldseepsis]